MFLSFRYSWFSNYLCFYDYYIISNFSKTGNFLINNFNLLYNSKGGIEYINAVFVNEFRIEWFVISTLCNCTFSFFCTHNIYIYIVFVKIFDLNFWRTYKCQDVPNIILLFLENIYPSVCIWVCLCISIFFTFTW